MADERAWISIGKIRILVAISAVVCSLLSSFLVVQCTGSAQNKIAHSLYITSTEGLGVSGEAIEVSPLVVSFSCVPSGGIPPYAFFWTFGDGDFSVQQNVTHIYPYKGTYNVTLTVTDSSSQDINWKDTVETPAPQDYSWLLGAAGGVALVAIAVVGAAWLGRRRKRELF